jgi:hypothetical protein
MWCFLRNGFLSIVQDKDNENYLVVRARVRGDIEAYWPTADVTESPENDYRYRTRLLRSEVASVISDYILNDLNHTNYKAAVNMVDPRRSEYYGMVWAIMADLQFEFLDKE